VSAGGFYVCYYVDGSYYARDYVSSLSAGSTTTTSFSWTADCGSHSIKAVADCYDAVTESNEGNNARTEYINIVCKPDLIVQDISWDKDSPKRGDTITFYVKVKNQGSWSAGSSTVKYYIDGSYVTSDSVPGLSTGSTSTQTFTWTANKCGNVQVKAVADANKNIEESDETNNEMEKSLNIKCPELPDLIVESITWKIKEGTENTVEVTVTIKNQGEADAKGFTVKYYVDDKEVDSDSISSLSKGGTTARTFEWNASGKSPGDHEVKVIADVSNKIKESREDNNVKTTTITCIDIEVVSMEIVQVIKSSKLNNNLVCDKPFEVWLRVQTTPSANELKRKGIEFSRFIFVVEAKIGDTKINENEKSQLWGKQYGFADDNIVLIYSRIRDPGKYTVDASIHGPIYRVTGHEYPDPNLNNNKNKTDVVTRDVKWWNFKNFKSFKIYYMPIDFTHANFPNFVSTAEVNNLFLATTYPIPKSRLISSYNTNILSSPPSLWPTPTWTKENNTLLWIELELFRTLVRADRLVGIVPEDWFNDKKLLGLFKQDKSVLVEEWAAMNTAAHEIGHTFRLCEEYNATKIGTPQCPYSFENPNAPGVNPGEDPNDVIPDGRKSDAYPRKTCMMGMGEKDKWICPNCYMHLFKVLIGEPKKTSEISSQSLTEMHTYQSPTEVLFVSGIVYKNGSVEFYELSRMKDQIPDQITPGNYSIECLDADGKVLSETPFDVSFYTEYGEVNVTGFAFTIPYQSGTKKVVVKYKEELKDEFVLSANSPTVSVISPNGGESFSGSFTVTWTASDPDGDELSYTLLYSNNEGADWSILAMDINETSHAVNTSMLGGGTKCMVKVIASDGANTAEDISNGCFTVETKNPIATISSPENNSEFMEWDRIEFSGFGYDFDDGILPDESLAWTSSIDGVIGHGSSFSNTSLSTGEHLITLTARDSEGETANATIMINVLSRKPTPIFNFTPSKIFVNQRVTFNASLSYDLDGNITN
ncbi:hypothetical protein J7L13_00965, partial [bacterium]|nr:hypothetical protein [bacterium]